MYLIGLVAVGVVVIFGFVLNVAGVTTFVERRVWARIQSRVGPNRVGPQGILQWLADGIKLLMKEDIDPRRPPTRACSSWLPTSSSLGFVAAFVVIPFSSALIVADLNVGILYLTAVTSLVVVGILMAGWASNNKWSLIGGIRAAAQIVSYEIPAALSIFPVVLITGTLQHAGDHPGSRVGRRGTGSSSTARSPSSASSSSSPALLAEGNRTPFDLPEAESELVAGFVTEYSGVRYLFFFLVEWGNLYVIGAVMIDAVPRAAGRFRAAADRQCRRC